MKRIKSRKLNTKKAEFNPKNKTHRANLYSKVFIAPHNTESLLFTLQKEAINMTSKTAVAALDPTPENLLILAQAIADINIAIEINELAIPKLHEASVVTKYSKLTTLNNKTDGIEEAKKLKPEQKDTQPVKDTPETEKAIKEFGQSIPEKRSFFGFFKHCWNY